MQEFSNRFENISPPHDCLDNISEIVFQENNSGCIFGHLSTSYPHSKPNISFLKSWSIISPISCHSNHVVLLFQTYDHCILITWSRSSHHCYLWVQLFKYVWFHNTVRSYLNFSLISFFLSFCTRTFFCLTILTYYTSNLVYKFRTFHNQSLTITFSYNSTLNSYSSSCLFIIPCYHTNCYPSCFTSVYCFFHSFS